MAISLFYKNYTNLQSDGVAYYPVNSQINAHGNITSLSFEIYADNFSKTAGTIDLYAEVHMQSATIPEDAIAYINFINQDGVRLYFYNNSTGDEIPGSSVELSIPRLNGTFYSPVPNAPITEFVGHKKLATISWPNRLDYSTSLAGSFSLATRHNIDGVSDISYFTYFSVDSHVKPGDSYPISYTIKHYLMNTDGNNYTLDKTTTNEAKPGSTITLSNLMSSYDGFTYSSAKVGGTTQTTLSFTAGMASPTVNLYYTRNKYKVQLSTGMGVSSVTGAGEYYYGATVSVNAVLANGFKWYQWIAYGGSTVVSTSQKYTFTMPLGDVHFQALASEILYTITYDTQGGSTVSSKTYNITSAIKLADAPTKAGCDFLCWQLDTNIGNWTAGEYTPGQQITGKYGDITLKAIWYDITSKTIPVRHYIQRLNDTGYELDDAITLQVQFGDTVAATDQVRNIEGFTYSHAKVDGIVSDSVTAVDNGANQSIDLYYTRNKYFVTMYTWETVSNTDSYAGTFNPGDSVVLSGSRYYFYEEEVTIDAQFDHEGFEWSHWISRPESLQPTDWSTIRYSFSMPAQSVIFWAGLIEASSSVKYIKTTYSGEGNVDEATPLKYTDSFTAKTAKSVGMSQPGHRFINWTLSKVIDGENVWYVNYTNAGETCYGWRTTAEISASADDCKKVKFPAGTSISLRDLNRTAENKYSTSAEQLRLYAQWKEINQNSSGIYIYDSTESFNEYDCYMYTEEGWAQVMPYVYKDSGWV